MKKILAKIMLCIMVINTIFSNFTTTAFAKTKSVDSLSWQKEATLNDRLEIVPRGASSDEVFLHWNIEKLGGTTVASGEYILSYPISNGKNIEFKIVKQSETKAIVTYKVNGDNTVQKNNKPLLIYKEGLGYVEANKTNFPPTDENNKINNFYADGLASKVDFTIGKGNGFSFQYQGNIIKFLWDKSGNMYFVTNSIAPGNIYPFNLDVKHNGTTKNEKLNIFTGIDTIRDFKVKPFANKDNTAPDGKEVINQTTRPIQEYTGADIVGIDLEFNTPKEWDEASKSYKFLTNTVNKDTQVVISLGQLENNKSIQINIPNIYDTTKPVIVSGPATATFKYENNKIKLRIEGLKSSTIYKDISISAERQKEPFQSIPSKLPTGAVYTYPSYRVVSLGEDEFYLEIEPFKGYDGYYTIFQGNTQSTLQKWAVHEEKKKGNENILIAVPLSALNPHEKYFRVDFSFTPTDLTPSGKLPFTSQILIYKPFEEDIALGTPKNLKITEANIIKKDDEDENLFVTFKWDIGNEKVIKSLMDKHNPATGSKNLNIKYLFNKGEQPDIYEENEFAGVNLEFKNETIGSIKNNIEYTLPPKKDNGTDDYLVDVIKEKSFTTSRVENTNGKDNTILEANVTFKVPVSAKTDINKRLLQYPNVYFITMKGKYTIDNGTTINNPKTTITSASLPAVLTLNGILKIEPPVPQNLKVVNKSIKQKEFSIEHDTLRYEDEKDILYDYNEIMLKNIGRHLDHSSVRYNFYITQDKAIFDEMITLTNNNKPLPDTITDKIKTYNYSGQIMPTNGIDLDMDTEEVHNISLIDILRKNEVLEISNITQNFNIAKQKINFKSLDENQTYYIIGRTAILPREGMDLLENKIDLSKYSKIISATTLNKDDDPTDEEKIPTAPNKFIAKDVTLNSANLIWDRVEETTDANDKSSLEYQFIKVKGEALDEKILKSKDSYKKTWENLSAVKNKDGLKTEGSKIFEFDKTGKEFSTTEANTDRYEYINHTGTEGNILDKTLSPNQIYYYYIRTVRVNAGEDKAYSVWVPLSFTTKNINAPTNLRVEPKAEYNKKTEVVISFDIPKMDLELMGKEYDLQYSIKKDSGSWGEDTTMSKNDCTFKENPDGKTIKVTYKIKNLESGKMYTIRVKMFNKIMNSSSMYSNQVDHRTDTDNIDNEYEEDVNDLEDEFLNQVEKIKNQPYWYAKDTLSNTKVYYRPQYFDTIINSAKDSTIELAAGKGGSYKEYYLPASSITKAFDANKGFKISHNGADVVFTAKSIDPSTNESIKKIVEELKSKDNLTKDYFIKITVDFKNSKQLINGINNVSPIFNISTDVVGTRTLITELDEKMLKFIDELLKTDEFSKNVKEKIEKLLKDKVDNKIILQEIAKMTESFKTTFGEKLATEITNVSRKTLATQKLNGNILIAYQVEAGLSAYGYRRVLSSWNSLAISDYIGKKAIYTMETGEYTFTAKKLVINGVGNLPNGDKITQIVIDYGLEDFLGKDGNINLKAPMTRYMAVGSLARVAGASKTQDPIEFFKFKGIVLTTRNTTANIPAEETIYLAMKIYEMKTGTKIESVKIKNYNLTANIKNINNNYKKSIQVAFDTGIYKNQNINAKGTITVQEFLEMLANMSSMVSI